jgi:hypothetical protein
MVLNIYSHHISLRQDSLIDINNLVDNDGSVDNDSANMIIPLDLRTTEFRRLVNNTVVADKIYVQRRENFLCSNSKQTDMLNEPVGDGSFRLFFCDLSAWVPMPIFNNSRFDADIPNTKISSNNYRTIDANGNTGTVEKRYHPNGADTSLYIYTGLNTSLRVTK